MIDPDSVPPLAGPYLAVVIGLVTAVIAGMFLLTLYNLSAPRSTMKNVLGLKRWGAKRRGDESDRVAVMLGLASGAAPARKQLAELVKRSSTIAERTTRTVLAITGFSMLAITVVALFGLGGPGVRDLRSQVVGAITTLVAAISGFYFGSRSADSAPSGTAGDLPGPATAAPGLAGPDRTTFVIGEPKTYTPVVTGTPAPLVTVTPALPAGLALNPATGAIGGIASGDPTTVLVTLTAANGVVPDATLGVSVTTAKPE